MNLPLRLGPSRPGPCTNVASQDDVSDKPGTDLDRLLGPGGCRPQGFALAFLAFVAGYHRWSHGLRRGNALG